MEQGRSEAYTSRVNRTLRDFQGQISFEKKLGSTAVSPPYVLTLPSSLWRQHGDKIQQFVILQSVANREKWTVKTYTAFRRGTGSSIKFPLVTLQTGWKAFVVANGLVKGDQLRFTLTEISRFEVLVLRSGAAPKLPSVESPKFRAKLPTFSQRQPQQFVETSVRSERGVNLLAPKTTEDSSAHSASTVSTYASEIPSDMNSRFCEPDDALLKSSRNRDGHGALSRFCKRISGSHPLVSRSALCVVAAILGHTITSLLLVQWFENEIPSRFLKSHWTQIGATYVKLQGVHDDSQVHNVMCSSVVDGGHPRLFFKPCCWSAFVKDNALQIGQKLSFTLSADSFFRVRQAEESLGQVLHGNKKEVILG